MEYSLSLFLSLSDTATLYRPFECIRQTTHGVVADRSHGAPTTASVLEPSNPLLLPTAAQEQPGDEEVGVDAGADVGYVARFKVAVLDCVNTAKKAPETFEEALAVIKGERAVKPDYGRSVNTVSAVRCAEINCCSLILKGLSRNNLIAPIRTHRITHCR